MAFASILKRSTRSDCKSDGSAYGSSNLSARIMYNLNIPHFYCLLRKEHLYQNNKHFGEYENVAVFGAQSNAGKALLFTVMLDNGTIRSRVPIHMLCHKESKANQLDVLQLWDCFSENVTVTTYNFLRGARAKVIFKDTDKL